MMHIDVLKPLRQHPAYQAVFNSHWTAPYRIVASGLHNVFKSFF